MTAVVGLRAMDGIVICADRQFTKEGGLKFQGTKIAWCLRASPNMELVFGYSGNRDSAAAVFDSVSAAVFGASYPGSTDAIIHYQRALAKAFKMKEARELESLIAIQTSDECLLYRSHANKVLRGNREFIGVGDSSVLRYWSDIPGPAILTLKQAEALGVYLISLANRYIDGCGFGIDMVVISKGHRIRILGKRDTAKYANQFSEFEKAMEQGFYRVCQDSEA